MNKKHLRLLTLVVIYSMIFPPVASAYNLTIDVGTQGQVNYSYPSVLGDDDEKKEEKREEKQEEKKEEKKEEKREEKKEEKREEKKPESKPSRVEPRPAKIEVKKNENAPKVKLINKNKTTQELAPEKVEIRLPSAPKNPKIEIENDAKKKDDGPKTTETEVEDEDQNEVDDDTNKTLKERSDRKFEKVEIQSEVHDDGTVELQVESRNVKAKVKTGEIEVDVANNSIGSTKQSGEGVELIHLPDQAMQKFIDRGLSTVPDTLEIGQSGDQFEYTVNARKIERIFGVIPRETKYKLKLDDQNGTVTEQKVADNILDSILNLFTF